MRVEQAMDERGRELGGVAATHLIEASERVTRSTIESIGAGSSSFVSPPKSAAVLTASPAAARKDGATTCCASSVAAPSACKSTCPPRLACSKSVGCSRGAFAVSPGVGAAASRGFVTAAVGGGRGGW